MCATDTIVNTHTIYKYISTEMKEKNKERQTKKKEFYYSKMLSKVSFSLLSVFLK